MLAHPAAISSLCLSRDGREAVSAGHDASIRFWSLEKRICTQDLGAHRVMRGEGVCCVCWSHDGRLVVSAGGDGVVKADDGCRVRISQAREVALPPFGRSIVSHGTAHRLILSSRTTDLIPSGASGGLLSQTSILEIQTKACLAPPFAVKTMATTGGRRKEKVGMKGTLEGVWHVSRHEMHKVPAEITQASCDEAGKCRVKDWPMQTQHPMQTFSSRVEKEEKSSLALLRDRQGPRTLVHIATLLPSRNLPPAGEEKKSHGRRRRVQLPDRLARAQRGRQEPHLVLLSAPRGSERTSSPSPLPFPTSHLSHALETPPRRFSFLVSLPLTQFSLKVNWQAASDAFGSASAASFKKMVANALKKVKDAEALGGDGIAAAEAKVAKSSAATGKKRKGRTDEEGPPGGGGETSVPTTTMEETQPVKKKGRKAKVPDGQDEANGPRSPFAVQVKVEKEEKPNENAEEAAGATDNHCLARTSLAGRHHEFLTRCINPINEQTTRTRQNGQLVPMSHFSPLTMRHSVLLQVNYCFCHRRVDLAAACDL
nr:striatin pro11 [Quercus suber]